MAKKQNFYYVLVFTNDGPVFVTSIDRASKTAHWNKNEAPLELGKYGAEDLTLGLNLNFIFAVTVVSKVELETQPYLYSKGQFEWHMEGVDNE